MSAASGDENEEPITRSPAATPIIIQCNGILTDQSIFRYFSSEVGQFQPTLVSSAAVFWDVTQRSPQKKALRDIPKNGWRQYGVKKATLGFVHLEKFNLNL